MIEIRSRDNPIVKDCIKLLRAGGYDRSRGLIAIEGEHLLAVALLKSPEQVRAIFLPEGRWPWPKEPGELSPRTKIIALPTALFAQLSNMPSPPGAIAILSRPSPSEPIREGFVLALDAVQDPGNVGTLIRTAAAAGCDQVWVDRLSAGAWSAKTLRAAQGAQWLVPVLDGLELTAALADFRGIRWASLPRTDGRRPLDSVQALQTQASFGPSRCLILSNEGQGLSPALESMIDRVLTIPMAAGVESLNVAAAGALALYALAPPGRLTA